MQVRINIKAGVPVRQEFTGKNLMLLDTGAADAVDLLIEVSGFGQESLRGMRRGLKLRTPGFTGVTISADVDTTVEIVATVADIDINTIEDAVVRARIIDQPVAVVPDRGAPGNPAYVVGLTQQDAPASAIVDRGPVAVGDVAVEIAAASAVRREVRVRNLGPAPVAIGSPGVTWARRAVVLEGEDLWIESRAANLRLMAVCPAGGAAEVNVQEVLS